MKISPGALFAHAAIRFPQRVALDDEMTFAELEANVRRVASAFSSLGLDIGARVGVLFFNRRELVAVWLGLERAGLVRVVLHSHFPVDVHFDMLARTDVKAVIFDTRFTSALADAGGAQGGDRVFVGVGPECPDWAIPYAELLEQGDDEFEAPEVSEDDPVCIQPTTGTTGAPKPWVVSHRAWTTLVAHNIFHLSAMSPFAEDEVNLHVHALQWASGAQTLLPYLVHGARTVLLDDERFDPAVIASSISASAATGLLLPGPMLAPLLDVVEAQAAFSHRLRRLVVLFATSELLERATRVLGPVWCHGYGSTEQGAPATRLLARDGSARLASVGRPASPLIEVAISGEGGERLPAGRVGEIVTRSPMSDGRYWGSPALTEAAFHADGWFRSGDLGALDTQGFLSYVDRNRDVIATDAGAVYPHEVESAVLRHAAVANCGAVGLGEPGSQEILAAVQLKQGETADVAAIAEVANHALPAHARPRILIVEDLPVVLGGAKVQRDVLRERLVEARV
jgi:acyl-coenzyme A synthetase/AMP-(fatty) acid ligase